MRCAFQSFKNADHTTNCATNLVTQQGGRLQYLLQNTFVGHTGSAHSPRTVTVAVPSTVEI
jgi:hypothetical protein